MLASATTAPSTLATPEYFQIPFRIRSIFTFKKPVSPGDQIILNVKIDRILKGIWKYSGVAKVDGAVVAEASMMCILKNIDKK